MVAYLPGETDEYIVIGAHYDHLGLGEQFSLAPSLAGVVHPGADDNASGTAGVIELARYFAAKPKPKRGFLFITFAGEELGLLGSEFYANHPELPLNKAVTMINLDMIGRVREGKVYIGGIGTGSTLRADLNGVAAALSGSLKPDGYRESSGYGSSDHTHRFTAKQVPVLFFFSAGNCNGELSQTERYVGQDRFGAGGGSAVADCRCGDRGSIRSAARAQDSFDSAKSQVP